MAVRAYLFDAQGLDREVELDAATLDSVGGDRLLWVDAAGVDEDTLRRLAELFGLQRESLRVLREPIGRPRLDTFGDYFQLALMALVEDGEGEGSARAIELDVVVGAEHLLTVHPEELPFLDELREHISRDSDVGRLDAPAFLAVILDWHVTSYFRIVEELEKEVDRLDAAGLQADRPDDLLDALVRVRRRIGRVRRAIAPHRELYAALSRPDFEVVARSDSAAAFRALQDRMERAIESVEHARESLIGSFDLLMTRTAQRTNEIMKLLTLVSVVLLPAVVIAGVMGMNFKVAFFDEPAFFWVVIGFMILLAAGTLVAARVRRWI
ncbi:MAG TPA: CorA family divalent cation transporter [Candidatus Limnocylindrales bacterium]|nr:CorA family divalent cation transporter [Candidatus Limnocylindrales bacterium]